MVRARRNTVIRAGVWALAFFVGYIPAVRAQYPAPSPSLPIPDRIRLAEAFRIARQFQDKVWEGWSKAPFAVLLINSTGEFLVGHRQPTADFAPFVYDTILQTGIMCRPGGRFPENLVATFPAVGGAATIVIGPPEEVSKSSVEWVISVLHEHFHQLQMGRPDYAAAVESLGLSGGDKSGRWMIDYPFPYDSAGVDSAFAELGRLLVGALRGLAAEKTERALAYLEARKRFQELLSPNEYRYFSFQLWQEGVARYTELRMADLAARAYKPTERFRSLLDFTSFRVVSDSLRSTLLAELADLSLQKRRRIGFYTLGAGEALLLDQINPGWQKRYFKEKFFLEKYF